MTKAQKAITKTMQSLIHEIGRPLSPGERGTLVNILRNCKSESLWGTGIRKVFEDGGDPAHVDRLIEQLADQASDNIFTMTCIVGQDGARLLLRTIQS